jgi:hypothetical protein
MKRFSIRDLLWLTLVVVLLLVWWIDHRYLEARSRFTVQTIRTSDGEPTVLIDNENPDVCYVRDAEGWKVAWTIGTPPPTFKPEP